MTHRPVGPGPAIHVFSTIDALAAHAAQTLIQIAGSTRDRRIAIALSGGKTPATVDQHLAALAQGAIDWSGIEVFFSDERSVPPDHPDSNYGLAHRQLLSRVPIPAAQIHRLEGDARDLDAAARRAEAEIRAHLPSGANGIPVFDLIWLGIGTDGHTASLFPGTTAVGENSRLVVANVPPAPLVPRLTFTFPLINAARRIQLLVVGAEKAAVVEEILGRGGGETSMALAARVRPTNGRLEWLLDAAAGARLPLDGNTPTGA